MWYDGDIYICIYVHANSALENHNRTERLKSKRFVVEHRSTTVYGGNRLWWFTVASKHGEYMWFKSWWKIGFY